MRELFDSLIDGLIATTPLEAASVLLGLAYSILAVKRNRWCWLAGGLSSSILIYLSTRAQLPMQAILQAYYVAVSFYGFWQWSRQRHEAPLQVSTWPLRSHLLAWIAILLASIVSSRWLAGQTQAAWPFLDSVTTWASLLAAWLVARMKLENWLYWIATDSVLVFLFVRQGSMAVACLFAAYLIISVFGFLSWLKNYRQPSPAQ